MVRANFRQPSVTVARPRVADRVRTPIAAARTESLKAVAVLETKAGRATRHSFCVGLAARNALCVNLLIAIFRGNSF